MLPRFTPVMLRVTPVMLRAVAASRKSPWNDLNPDILDCATDARNDGVRLPCPFRYAVALAKARCRRWARRLERMSERGNGVDHQYVKDKPEGLSFSKVSCC